jgi:hypothetical protein
MRTCPKCKQTKPEAEFYTFRLGCRACTEAQNTEREAQTQWRSYDRAGTAE